MIIGIDTMSEEPRSYRNESFNNVSILLIDDESEQRNILKRMLHKLNISNIIESVDGANGLCTLKIKPKFEPDIIICDLEMEPYDGLYFLEHYRKEFPNYKSKIIVLSGHTERELIYDVIKYNVDRFSPKPICLKKLYNTIKESTS